MDIKLRARLSAYSLVDTFDQDDPDHVCENNMIRVTESQIDKLFDDTNNGTTSNDADFTNFVDSLFAEG